MKKIITTLFTIIFLINLISAIGITYPHPQDIELKPGQSSYFTFQIQSDDFPLICVPSIQEDAGLEFAFNPQYEIEANQKYNVKPQIIIPKQTPFGNYEANFCIECSPSQEVEGSKIIPRICDLPITVNIRSERTRTNMLEKTESLLILWISLLIIAIVILTIIIFYLIKKKRRASL